MWHAHTLGYYSASKKEDNQSSATTWMNLGHTYAQRNKPDIEGYILYIVGAFLSPFGFLEEGVINAMLFYHAL